MHAVPFCGISYAETNTGQVVTRKFRWEEIDVGTAARPLRQLVPHTITVRQYSAPTCEAFPESRPVGHRAWLTDVNYDTTAVEVHMWTLSREGGEVAAALHPRGNFDRMISLESATRAWLRPSYSDRYADYKIRFVR